MAVHVPGLIRRQERDHVGHVVGFAESSQRNRGGTNVAHGLVVVHGSRTWCGDEARAHCVRANTARPPLESGLLGEGHDARLRRRVRTNFRVGSLGRDRHDVHDRAAAVGEHRTAEGTRAMECATHVDRQRAGEILGRHVFESAEAPRPGVVDENAHRAVLTSNVLGDRVDGPRVGDVAGDHVRRPRRARLGRDDIESHHPETVALQAVGDGGTDAASGPGDDGDSGK